MVISNMPLKVVDFPEYGDGNNEDALKQVKCLNV